MHILYYNYVFAIARMRKLTAKIVLLNFLEYCEQKYSYNLVDKLKRDLTSKCGEEHW